MLAAIAFCPSPPLLVPELAAGAAVELDALRAACARAVRSLLDTGADELVVLGTGPVTSWFPPGTTGGLDGYGVPRPVRLPGPLRSGEPAPDPLPLSLVIGAWLLGEAGEPCPGLAVGPDADPAAVAAGLEGAGRRALLVMGDGSARRSEQAPGYVDPRAAGFDAAVATALRTGAAAALCDLDPALGADLLAAGVPAWRTAGTAALTARPTPGRTAAAPDPAAASPDPAAASPDPAVATPGPAAWRAELLYDAAPYGVGYFVAVWT